MRYLIRAIIVLFSVSALVSCNKSDCGPQECLNNGVCEKGICECPEGFDGLYCELTPCDKIKCYNGATCNNGACECPPGFEGVDCSIANTPATVALTKVVITQFPTNSSDTPDIFIQIIRAVSGSQLLFTNVNSKINNADNSIDHTFIVTPNIVKTNLTQFGEAHFVKLYDYNAPGGSYNDLIAEASFVFWEQNRGLPEKIDIYGFNFIASVYFSYTF